MAENNVQEVYILFCTERNVRVVIVVFLMSASQA